MKYPISWCLLLMGLLCVFPPPAHARTKAKPQKACVSVIHVIKGCSACEAMQKWLRDGGVELEISSVEQGAYKLYPTVIYSDKVVDHGERMYRQLVTIPDKICVISCSVGTN